MSFPGIWWSLVAKVSDFAFLCSSENLRWVIYFFGFVCIILIIAAVKHLVLLLIMNANYWGEQMKKKQKQRNKHSKKKRKKKTKTKQKTKEWEMHVACLPPVFDATLLLITPSFTILVIEFFLLLLWPFMWTVLVFHEIATAWDHLWFVC